MTFATIVFITAGCPALGLANHADTQPKVQRDMSGEWRELRSLQAEIRILKEKLNKEHRQLQSLAARKQVKLNMIQYQSLMDKVRQLQESDKRLRQELTMAGQTGSEDKINELLRAITAHKRLEASMLRDAEKLLVQQIRELQRQ
jgi:uncharacterized protein YegL